MVAAVLSGNRNFEGRVNSLVKANYLASPPLVVAYALAGRVDVDLQNEPLGTDTGGVPVYLRDIWPSNEEVQDAAAQVACTRRCSGSSIPRSSPATSSGTRSPSRPARCTPGTRRPLTSRSRRTSTHWPIPPSPPADLEGMRALAMLGDSVTTDHISPAGSIAVDGPAGQYLIGLGVQPKDFNSYGSRRGNHEVMMRGTLANVRLRNQLAPGTEGGWTTHMPLGREDVDLRRRHALQAGGRRAADPGRARNTAPAPRATGRPRASRCWA